MICKSLMFPWTDKGAPHFIILNKGLKSSLYRCVSVCTQGKSFIKDALKCMAHGLRHKFSCISRKCVSIKEMVFQLQRECYIKHNLCSAAKDNVAVMVEMIHFQDLFPKGWVAGLYVSSFFLIAHLPWVLNNTINFFLPFFFLMWCAFKH